jgi:uncharacterized protein (DUF2147 family)
VAGRVLPARRAVLDAVDEMKFLAMSLSALKVGAVGVALWTAAAYGSVMAQAKEPTAAGLWEKVDASGRPEAWFRIVDCGGTYEGQIVKIFPKPGEPDPSQWRCTNCQGEQKNAPVLGITFIKGMQRHGLTYENGTILDPRNGSDYSARMELSPDGHQLTVRGYLGISLLGQSQVWRRIPDDRLEGSSGRSCTHGARPG